MTPPRIGLCFATTIAIVAFPAVARAGEAIVPPGNSAAAQYTEAFPTGGGNKDVTQNNRRRPPTPAKALGGENARQLEGRGPLGEEAAAVAAATSPPIASQPGPSSGGKGAASPGSTALGGSGTRAEQGEASTAPAEAARPPEPSGSSGLGELASATTGGSGSSGLLLLAIFGGAFWGIAYILRRRRKAG
jgi:hypothetical protein